MVVETHSLHEHDGVVVDVDDPALRRDRLDDLVEVRAGGDSCALTSRSTPNFVM
jgi:hypothetical protein